MHELATVEVSENLLLEVPHHFVDFMVLRQITATEEGTSKITTSSKQDALGSERCLIREQVEERPYWEKEEVVE